MRKMPYAIIFIIILAILVFAGCKAFSGNSTTDPAEEASTSDPAGESESGDVLETILSGIENLTDDQGQTLFSGDDISSLYEDLSSSIAAEESASAAESEASSLSAATDSSTEVPAGEPTSEGVQQTEAPTEAPAETTAETPADSTTEAPAESTTQATAESTTETPAESTTAAVPTANEYDILRSGSFYMDGTMYSDGENNPVTLAVSDDLVYMQATMDGMTMGLLVQDKKTYLLNPPTKTYCEFGSVLSGVLKKAGMMSEDEIKEFIDSMGFSTMEDLDQADSVTTGTIGSTTCDVYIFNKDDGTKTRVYLNGEHLLAFEVVDENGTVTSATYINTLTADIPKLPPEDYEKQNALNFIMSMEDMMDE